MLALDFFLASLVHKSWPTLKEKNDKSVQQLLRIFLCTWIQFFLSKITWIDPLSANYLLKILNRSFLFNPKDLKCVWKISGIAIYLLMNKVIIESLSSWMLLMEDDFPSFCLFIIYRSLYNLMILYQVYLIIFQGIGSSTLMFCWLLNFLLRFSYNFISLWRCWKISPMQLEKIKIQNNGKIKRSR